MTRWLFNPGPTNTSASVRQALATDDMSHRSPAFRKALDDVRAGILEVLGAQRRYGSVLLACSGTGANEAVAGMLSGPVLAIVGGRYSERMAELMERRGLQVDRFMVPRFGGIGVAAVRRALEQGHYRTLTFVHHETTTGVLAPLALLCRAAADTGVTTAVDAISSVGAHRLVLDDAGPDWVTVTANKGLESLPGVSLVVARRELLDAATSGRSMYFDLAAEWRAQSTGNVRFTLPVQLVFALREALHRLRTETPQGRAQRYQKLADLMRSGLLRRGFELVELPDGQRSNVVIPVVLPTGLDFPRVQAELDALGYEVYSARESLDVGYFFLATMGALPEDELHRFLDVFDATCRQAGAPAVTA
jgi:2-aminoethylphosphonate-pyruvate transaminase